MLAFPCVFRRTKTDLHSASNSLRFATVSLLALSAALSAGPARSECTQQGLDQTCTGNLGTINIANNFASSDQTIGLTIKDATNQSVTGPDKRDTSTWVLSVQAPGSQQTSARADLNVDLNGFELNAGIGSGIEVIAMGSPGVEPEEQKGKGDQIGGAGGYGGAGGAVSATISGVKVTSSNYNILAHSNGASGGKGADGLSDSKGSGYGGNGGVGGNGGAVTATVTDSTFNQGYGLFVASSGGEGGFGGAAEASKYTARGGDGGKGGEGGNIGLVVKDVTIQGATTGIAVQSRAGQAGMGGDGENNKSSTGEGGGGGAGGGGGGIKVSNTTADGKTGKLAIQVSSGLGILAESIAGNGGHGGEGKGKPATGGDGGQGGTGRQRNYRHQRGGQW